MDVRLEVLTLTGQEYVLYAPAGSTEWRFPHGDLRAGEAPAAAARRIVADWTGTSDPKLEVLDFRTDGGASPSLTIVFRALLTSEARVGPAAGEMSRAPRLGLPERVGPFTGREVEELQKTSLSYKLTRG